MTPKNADESREAGVTDEVAKLLVREFENTPWQLEYWRRWKIALTAVWPVAVEPAQTEDSVRHYLRWALGVLSEHGLSEFSLRVQQMHKEATKVLAATEPVEDDDHDGSPVAAEPAQSKCPICFEDEPHTGTCGSSDPRALCNLPIAQPADSRRVRVTPTTVSEMQQLLRKHGFNYGEDASESALVGFQVAALAAQEQPADSGRVAAALRGLLEIGKRDTTNPKYDSFWNEARAALAAQGQPAERVPDVRAMVNRFLGWSLPKDFAPDGGISFNPLPARHMPHCWPVGTNLFTAAQATAMVEYMLTAAPQPGEPTQESQSSG